MPQAEQLRIQSRIFQEEREVPVCLPPGYTPEHRYPVLYCFMPAFLFGRGLPEWLDEQVAAGSLSPCIAVGIPPQQGDDELDLYRFVATELLPAVEAAYAADPERSHRWLYGYSGGACNMIELGALYGDRFGKVAAGAPGWMFWNRERDAMDSCYLPESMARVQAGPGPMPDFCFIYGDADEGFEAHARPLGEEMINLLRSRGARVDQSLVSGGHSPETMKLGWPIALRWLQS